MVCHVTVHPSGLCLQHLDCLEFKITLCFVICEWFLIYIKLSCGSCWLF